MVDIKRLKKAHYAAAKIVEQLGEEYLMFFERIHRELMVAEDKQRLKLVALQVAQTDTKM